MPTTLTMPVAPSAPTGSLMASAVRQFCVTHAAATVTLADEGGIEWLSASLGGMLKPLDEQCAALEIETPAPDEILSHWFLACEMAAYCQAFRHLVDDIYPAGLAPLTDNGEFAASWNDMPPASSFQMPDKSSLETGEVIGESIPKIIEKLPKWLQKVVDALIEASKIARLQLD